MNTLVSNQDIWADDLLNRKPDADFLYTLLKGRSQQKVKVNGGSFVLNIDAEWGFGKTFFLERFALELQQKGHLVVTVNAWKDDHADDPFIAIIAALNEVITPYLGKETSNMAKTWKKTKKVAVPIIARTVAGVGKTFFKKYVGEDFQTISSEIVSDKLTKTALDSATDYLGSEFEKGFDGVVEKIIGNFTTETKAVTEFRDALAATLAQLANQKELPLFILIDELDRCRPNYAVALLERVKHLFDIPNIVFVFATNNNQLQHAIAGAYGPSFDGFRYLKRFFERSYTLQLPSPQIFTMALLENIDTSRLHSPGNDPSKFICLSIEQFGSDLREIQQLIDIIDTTITVWNSQFKIELVSLIVLIIQYLRSGECSWQGAKAYIPSNYIFDFGAWHSRAGISPEAKVNMSKIFNNVAEISPSLEKAITYYNDNNSQHPVVNYVNNIFISEWNGVPSPKQSVQLKLPDIIKSAGKLVNNE